MMSSDIPREDGDLIPLPLPPAEPTAEQRMTMIRAAITMAQIGHVMDLNTISKEGMDRGLEALHAGRQVAVTLGHEKIALEIGIIIRFVEEFRTTKQITNY